MVEIEDLQHALHKARHRDEDHLISPVCPDADYYHLELANNLITFIDNIEEAAYIRGRNETVRQIEDAVKGFFING